MGNKIRKITILPFILVVILSLVMQVSALEARLKPTTTLTVYAKNDDNTPSVDIKVEFYESLDQGGSFQKVKTSYTNADGKASYAFWNTPLGASYAYVKVYWSTYTAKSRTKYMDHDQEIWIKEQVIHNFKVYTKDQKGKICPGSTVYFYQATTGNGPWTLITTTTSNSNGYASKDYYQFNYYLYAKAKVVYKNGYSISTTSYKLDDDKTATTACPTNYYLQLTHESESKKDYALAGTTRGWLSEEDQVVYQLNEIINVGYQWIKNKAWGTFTAVSSGYVEIDWKVFLDLGMYGFAFKGVGRAESKVTLSVKYGSQTWNDKVIYSKTTSLAAFKEDDHSQNFRHYIEAGETITIQMTVYSKVWMFSAIGYIVADLDIHSNSIHLHW